MDNKHTALPSFFMLRAGELKVTIDCGCTLRNQVNTVFNYCPLHDAAPALLAALEQAHKRAVDGIKEANQHLFGTIGSLRFIESETQIVIEVAKKRDKTKCAAGQLDEV